MAFESYGVAMASLSTISSRGSSMDLDLQLDDEEALKWAAIERLSSTRSKSIRSCGNAEDILDVVNLGGLERRDLLERVLRVVEEDNEKLLRRILQRINAVGIELPTIEVRFENLFVNAKISVGSRAQPTNWNFIMNSIETVLEGLNLRASKRRDFTILNDVSGIIKPSRMTLLLGSPGSGKSTLLLALAGKLDPNLKAKGRVTYNGHDFNEFIPQKTSAYISQHDVHMGEMTVRQVLDFSARCQGVGNRYDMFAELCRRERDAGIKPDPVLDALLKAATMQGQQESIVTDYILKVLGLEFCADTLVGDNMQRGISGGQKKRVTIGEMIVGPAKALFMDEISTGLDSATTFQIVKYLRQTVHALGITLLVSLLQPSPETFELFDDIMLLSEGHIIYQGPRESVLDYFISKGFKCPERKNIADFVQEVTSIKDQKQYWADRTTPYCYVPVKTFADDFSSFHLGKALDEELKQPYDKTKSHPAALSTQKYGLAKWELLKACFSREWSLMKSNSSIYIFLFIKLLFLALVTMSVFFRTTMKHDTVQDGNKYQGALFFGLLNIMFNSFVELALTVKNLPVFYKQRDSFFYPAWAWSVPSTILRIPVSLMETAIWVFVSYWTIGFAPEIGRFFQQFIVLFMVSQMAQNIFRFLAGVGRNMLIASTFGNLALMLVFIMGGFIISRDDIPAWWIWSYWISPMMYGQNAIGANEFLAKRWQKSSNDSTLTIGEQVLRSRGLFANESWVWLGLGAEFGFAILFNIGFMVALTYLKPLSKSQAPLSEKLLSEKLATRTGVNVSNYSSSICELEDAKGLSTQNSRNIGKKEGFTKGMTLPFEPYTLAFDHINYYVDMPKQMRQEVVEERLQLLSDTSGVFRPGVLTALMGISGAGKTTLMDVLAGRKTAGYIEGSIMISGYPKKQETFARISGYCEQNDVHSPNLTVYESLYYSAWLRLRKEVDVKTRKLFVHEIMELVELTPLEGALVGLPGVMGLSTEQRKRLTIAVELVANPSIIFMDEPTSGLDARAAAIVMRTVRNTVNTGRTVVCTIHQPSIEIFEAFDELILMKRGGQIIYGGPLGTHSNLLVNYFEAVESIPKIPDGYNPATWMLEVTSEEVEARIGVDFVELYKSSPVYQQNQTFIKEASVPPAGSQDLYFATKYSQPFLTQLRACLWKQNLSYASNPHYVAIRMLFSMVTAVIFGSMFWNLGSKRGTQQDIFNVMGAMYSAVLFVGFNNATGVLEVILVERTVYYREKGAGMYSALPYTLAQVIIELPYILAQSLGFGVILYAMMNLEWTAAKFFWFLFFMFCTFSYMTFYGMVSAAITPDNQVASIIILACYSFWNLFAGFVITHNALPIWWKWCYWASPPAWSLYGLVASQLGDVQTLISIPGEGQKSVATYLDDYFGYKKDFLGVVGGLHVALVLIFALIYIAAIKYLNFQKR